MVGLFFFRHTHSRLATLPNKQPRTLKTIFLICNFQSYSVYIKLGIGCEIRLYTSLCASDESFSSFYESREWQSRNTVSWPRAFARTVVWRWVFAACQESRKTLRRCSSDYCLVCVWPFLFYFPVCYECLLKILFKVSDSKIVNYFLLRKLIRRLFA